MFFPAVVRWHRCLPVIQWQLGGFRDKATSLNKGGGAEFLVQEDPEHAAAPGIPLQLPAGEAEFPLGILQRRRLLLREAPAVVAQGIADLLAQHAQLPAGSVAHLHFPVVLPCGKAFPGHRRGFGMELGARPGGDDPRFSLDREVGVFALLVQGQGDLGRREIRGLVPFDIV